jgi:hypothetical protein
MRVLLSAALIFSMPVSHAFEGLPKILSVLNESKFPSNAISCSIDQSKLPSCDILEQKKTELTGLKSCFSEIMAQTYDIMKKNQGCNFNEDFRRTNAQKYVDSTATADQITNCNDVFKQALLCHLTEKQQEFIAAIIVTWGEVRGASGNYLPEYHGVRQVLENRKRLMNEQNPNQHLNLLHVALQENQFSLFNVDDTNWLTVLDPHLTSNKTSGPYVDKSLRAYMDYPSAAATCSPVEICQRIVNYYARWMKVSEVPWARDSEDKALPKADFSFNHIYQGSGTTNEKGTMSPLESKRRHWFFAYEDPSVGVQGVSPSAFNKATVTSCEEEEDK